MVEGVFVCLVGGNWGKTLLGCCVNRMKFLLRVVLGRMNDGVIGIFFVKGLTS